MTQAGFMLRGVLLAVLASGATAQSTDPDYSKLIFEVAAIPPIVEPGAANAAVDAPNASADAASTNASVTQTDPPAESANHSADIAAYRARISDILSTSSTYSVELREQYDALGTLLQRDGQHEEAIKVFDSAMHIDRVNGGLYTLDQIPIVEKLIVSHDALGNWSDVNDLHGYLFYIQQRSYDEGDPRLLVAMEEWADWNVSSYLEEGPRYNDAPNFRAGATLSTSQMEYVAVQQRDGSFAYIPRSQLTMPLRGGSMLDPAFSSMYGVDAERVIDERLRTARDYYDKIVEAQEENAEQADPGTEVRVQHKLANVAFAVKQQIAGLETVGTNGSMFTNRVMQPQSRPPLAVTRGYSDNRDALIAIAEALEHDASASTIDKAQAWISVGDWHIGYDYGARGAEAYRKAWDILAASGMDSAAINEVFMPDLLIPVPAFATHPYSRAVQGFAADADIAWKGYMDLTLNVNRYGDVSGAKVESASADTPQVVRRELLRYVRNTKVRPSLVDGEPVRRENVKLRYYYTY
jgi:tetratricopeptide (TPR) repeat protein